VADALEISLILPSYRPGASAEGMIAAVETCERLGWGTVWTTDHLLPDRTAPSRDYAHLFEALATLAWVGGRFERVRLGASVIVVPMRNAVVLAKEFASIDALTGGRLRVGVGVGWNEREFGNVGESERFHRRGAYLDETIRLWRHLWSGSEEPFAGRFHQFAGYAFSPLPSQGERLAILVGGRSEAALRRAGALGDGYHASAAGPATVAERVPIVLEAARDAGRSAPHLSARAQVRFGAAPRGFYALAGPPDHMLADLNAFAAAGATEVAVDFTVTDPEGVVAAMERFDREVVAALRA
jgi:probable F420-dependent oxidoreductase